MVCAWTLIDGEFVEFDTDIFIQDIIPFLYSSATPAKDVASQNLTSSGKNAMEDQSTATIQADSADSAASDTNDNGYFQQDTQDHIPSKSYHFMLSKELKINEALYSNYTDLVACETLYPDDILNSCKVMDSGSKGNVAITQQSKILPKNATETPFSGEYKEVKEERAENPKIKALIASPKMIVNNFKTATHGNHQDQLQDAMLSGTGKLYRPHFSSLIQPYVAAQPGNLPVMTQRCVPVAPSLSINTQANRTKEEEKKFRRNLACQKYRLRKKDRMKLHEKNNSSLTLQLASVQKECASLQQKCTSSNQERASLQQECASLQQQNASLHQKMNQQSDFMCNLIRDRLINS